MSNILLVLGLAMLIGPDRSRSTGARSSCSSRSSSSQWLLFLVPSVPGFHGDTTRHSLALLTLAVSIVLLAVYIAVTIWNLRRHHAAHKEEADEQAWSLRRSLVALGTATAVTALDQRDPRPLARRLRARGRPLASSSSSFVIVAIVGNAAEHGGAVVIAHRGNLELASEIAISSSAQVALFVVPAVAILSFLVTPALPLTFRPFELIAMGGAAAGVAYAVRDGGSSRWEGGATHRRLRGVRWPRLHRGRSLGSLARVTGVAARRRNKTVVVRASVTRRYGEGDTAVDALRGIDRSTIERGKLTAVMGPSGSGKSTLMHILAGLDKPTSGEVDDRRHGHHDAGRPELTKLRRRAHRLRLPVLQPAADARPPRRTCSCRSRSRATKPDKALLEELLETIGLADRRKHRPAELSGGQQQRVAIARALVSRPTVIFADEPTGNLDSKTSGEILELLARSVEEYGQTTVMVTHEARAAAIADRILFLADGLIVQRASADAAPARCWRVMDELDLGDPVRPEGPARAQAADRADRDRDRARRRDGHAARTSSPTRSRAPSTGSSREIYQGTDATITGKSAFDLTATDDTTAPPFDESLLPQVRALPDVADAVGGVGGEAHLDRQERQGDRLRRRAEPRLQRRPDAAARSTRSRSSTARGRGRTRSSSTRRRRRRRTSRSARRSASRRTGRCGSMRISGLVKFGGASSLGGATLAGFDLPTGADALPASRASSTRSARRRSRASRRRSSRPRSADPAAGHAGADRARRRRSEDAKDTDELPRLPAEVPARVRRHRALRRLLRDRELAVDHDRPAHARARDAADARRVAAAGAAARS